MKITKKQLKKIIKEEKAKLIKENEYFEGSMMDLDDHNRMVAQIDRIIINFTKMGYTREDVMEALKGILEEI
jgi:Holliday junction resolvasome RuvABC DNA-binding subunit